MRLFVRVREFRATSRHWSALVVAAIIAAAHANAAHAYSTFKVVHTFCSSMAEGHCRDGANPLSQLLVDQSGNVYSGPLNGGTLNNGVLLRIAPPNWKVLHNFCASPNTCPHGAQGDGSSGLISDVNGNLYGVSDDIHEGVTSGVLFKLSNNDGKWLFSTMYRFCRKNNCTDGANPTYDRLTYAGQGTGELWDGVSPLYGVLYFGGKYGGGVAYQMLPGASGWKESVIHNFAYDVAPRGLISDADGHLYGVAGNGGNNGGGFLYKLVQNESGKWIQTDLHYFCQGQHCAGSDPVGTLILDKAHNIFGVTYTGGSAPYCTVDYGCGTAFELTSNGQYKTIYNFCSLSQCADGNTPIVGPAMDVAGNLLGVTQYGGIGGYCTIDMGCGAVFELTQSGGVWSGAELHSFCSAQDCGDGDVAGATWPPGALTLDASGNIFGTAPGGGNAQNAGIIFEILH